MKLTIQEMKMLAKSKGGRCLSEEYINNHTKLKWQCKEGHLWEAAPSKIKIGRWCRICGIHNAANKRKLPIELIQKLAEAKDGKLLSKQYVNNRTKLEWQCKNGHVWKARPSDVKRGHWCPYCAGNIKSTIEEAQKLAEVRGGRCLSEVYIHAHANISWQCKLGHTWEAGLHSIKKGQWCPECSAYRSERVCREYFERIFNEKFPKKKPKWLISSLGRRLELDGYCEKLGLAFEYQGQQHYRYNTMFHKERAFRQQLEDDDTKRALCKLHGITLIEIPYSIEFENMVNYIIRKCIEKNIVVPKINKELDFKLFEIYSPETLEEMQELARIKGCECLSKLYINATTKLRWRCGNGHEWEATPKVITRGHWCHVCGIHQRANKRKSSIEVIQRIAESKDGKLLSRNYINNHSKLQWKCKEGHEWWNTPAHIKAGQWCPFCARSRKIRTAVI